MVLPTLMPFDGINPNCVVLMDNASIHQLIQSVYAPIHFPPYSPDLNPIEELFSKMKACLRENDEAIQSVRENAIPDIVQAAFATVTQ